MNNPEDLTEAQATDLARYQLGRAWRAVVHHDPHTKYQLHCDATAQIHVGDSWRDVFRQLKAWPATRPRFTWLHRRILDPAGETYAIAASKRGAERIGRALNAYTPDRRGK